MAAIWRTDEGGAAGHRERGRWVMWRRVTQASLSRARCQPSVRPAPARPPVETVERVEGRPLRDGVTKRTLGLVLGVLLAVAVSGAGGAQEQPPIDWEATGLSGPVSRLFAPTSGAFFAQTADGLQRSDDG